ncbi:MAG: succinate--CoA ligase subunit alpha [Planctomyces sp.]|nr:succinate--CoA ligase subunit alpha [Planctomyces sp.]MBA4040030.1 succinate--CoA ligase subunit alpha [Planctomyces sp.]MBA4119770.1 succinate--CoA ligase subunit alpha [Isosphaera sp.]
MAVLIHAETRVICQGITGAYGAQHTRGCLHYGTKLVGGVTPGKGGTRDANGLPIFDTVADAVSQTGATATMIFVPPVGAADAIIEAASAGVRVICAITEGVPVQDMIRARAWLDQHNASAGRGFGTLGTSVTLVGPNCPGVITPGPKTGAGTAHDDPYTSAGCKIGIMPGYIHTHVSQAKRSKAVAIVSRSGTLTYEAVWQTSALGLAQSTCIGIGGDPVRGLSHTDCLRLFFDDPDTHAVLLIGEIGGTDEIDAAGWIADRRAAGLPVKPVAGFIAGRTAPPGRRMGHAGAIIGGASDTAEAKIAALSSAGVRVAASPAGMGRAVLEAMGL